MSTESHADSQLKDLVDKVPGIGLWAWDLVRHEVVASQTWKEMHGIAPLEANDLIGRSLDAVHSDDRAKLESLRMQLVQGTASEFTFDYRVKTERGDWFSVEEHCHAIVDEHGKVVRLIGYGIDITSRNEQANELADQTHDNGFDRDLLPVAICWFRNGKCVDANESWVQMTGRLRESAIGDGWLEAIHPDDREQFVQLQQPEHFRSNGEETVAERLEGRLLKAEGSVQRFLAKIQHRNDGQRTESTATMAMIDLAERGKIDQPEARLYEILEATSDYVGIATPDRKIIWHNKQLRELRPDLSTTSGEADFAPAHPEWSRKIMEEIAIPAAIEKGSWSGEMAIYDEQGNEIPVSQVLITHKSENGELEALSTIMRDISAQKATEKALRESENMFSSLAASAPVAIFRMSDLENCVYVNQRWSELIQQPLEAALGRGWMNFVEPDDLDRILDLEAKFVADPHQKICEPYEARRVLPDGSTKWVLCTLAKEYDEHNNVTGYVGTLTDIDKVKKADEDLKQFNKRFRKVLNFSSIGVWQRSFADGELTWDDQMFEIYGVDPENFRGSTSEWKDRLHPDDADRIIAHQDTRVFGSHASSPEEYRIVRPNGEIRHIYSNIHLETDEHGRPIRVIGINMDITDLREVELALIESETKFHRIAENVPGMVYRYVVHTDGTDELNYVSSKVQDLYGVSPEDALTDVNKLWSMNHPDDLPRLRSETESSAKELTPFLCESRMLHPEKGERWIQTCAKPVQLQNGDVMWDGIQIDVTDHKQAELALQEAKTQIERITENVPGMVYRYVQHADGRHSASYVSAKCRELFEVEQEEVMRSVDSLFKWIPPDDMKLIEKAIEASSRTMLPFKEEYRVDLPKQGLRWRQAFGQPSKNTAGDTIWDGVVLDITDRKAAEDALLQANEELGQATRMKDQFLANMSHEFRTPLSAILGMTEGLQDGVFGSLTDRQQRSLQTIEQSGTHLLQLINEILDLARIESQQLELELTSVNLMELCESSLRMVNQQAEKKQIELRLNLSWNLPNIEADEKRLRQVFINLLGNAIKFTPEGGTVTLDLQKVAPGATDSEDLLQVSVSDNGIGIDEAHLGSLFEPFVQADTTLSRNHDGVGLGLALVKQFVELHSGTVSVTSEPDIGSCFRVEIPYRRADDDFDAVETNTTRQAIDVPAAPLAPPTVLLVEDNEAVAESVVAYLTSCNFEVQLATDGISALQAAEEFSPDIVLMDVQLPKLDGLQTIRKIREMPELTRTPIIALTGRAMPGDAELCLKAGADRYLSKPSGVKELVKIIRELIAKAE